MLLSVCRQTCMHVDSAIRKYPIVNNTIEGAIDGAAIGFLLNAPIGSYICSNSDALGCGIAVMTVGFTTSVGAVTGAIYGIGKTILFQ